jgi:hypothetical protein
LHIVAPQSLRIAMSGRGTKRTAVDLTAGIDIDKLLAPGAAEDIIGSAGDNPAKLFQLKAFADKLKATIDLKLGVSQVC